MIERSEIIVEHRDPIRLRIGSTAAASRSEAAGVISERDPKRVEWSER